MLKMDCENAQKRENRSQNDFERFFDRKVLFTLPILKWMATILCCFCKFFFSFRFLFCYSLTVACKKSSKLKPANNIQMHQMELNKEVETVFRFLPLSRTFIQMNSNKNYRKHQQSKRHRIRRNKQNQNETVKVIFVTNFVFIYIRGK